MKKKTSERSEFMKRTEEAWKKYERGEFKKKNFDEFIEELRKR